MSKKGRAKPPASLHKLTANQEADQALPVVVPPR
jgi:hypothetical protein